MAGGSRGEQEPGRTRPQTFAVALVCLLSGLLVGFVVVAIVVVGDPGRDPAAGRDRASAPAPPAWRRVASSSGRWSVELPGTPADDAGTIHLGADRAVPVATRYATTSDGTTATIAELDYSSSVGGDGYDLRLGVAGAVVRAGASMHRFEEVASDLGRAASFSGSGDDVAVQGFLVANGGEVVLLLVRSPSGSDAADAAILRMASTLSRA